MNDIVNALIGPDPNVYSLPGASTKNWALVEGLLQSRINSGFNNSVTVPPEVFTNLLNVLINPQTQKPFENRSSLIL